MVVPSHAGDCELVLVVLFLSEVFVIGQAEDLQLAVRADV